MAQYCFSPAVANWARPRCGAKQDAQHPGGHWVEGARVSDPPGACQAADLIDHIVGSDPAGLSTTSTPLIMLIQRILDGSQYARHRFIERAVN